jgi:formate hydrogenlyase transcriptional activator
VGVSSQNGASILLVDDTPTNLAVLCEIFADSGFDLLIAEDGISALEQIGYARPDLILLDVLMPGLSGFETCRKLKENAETRDIPVIFMTALAETEQKLRGFGLGAVDYITKPFQHEEVLTRVKTHLTLHRLKKKLQENEERLSRIIEGAMDAILTLDQQGFITLFNLAAERIFRCTAAGAIGQSCEKFLGEKLRRLINEYRAAARTDLSSQKPIWIAEGHGALRADGEIFSIEASLSRVEAAGDQIFILILRDVEERNKAEAEARQLRGLNRYFEDELRAVRMEHDLIGVEGGLRDVMNQVMQVSETDATVLVTGETGTGKELIAQAIHRASKRRDQPFIKLNCATLPANLIESELFGHEKGAFTGAVGRKTGRFELADGGTLFLDEIGELALELQAKLLRVLQEGEYERVGGTRTLTVDVRVIAATNRNLAQSVRQAQFRSDLFYRLNVFPIALPPLRERKEDIAALAEYFIERYATKYGKSINTLPEGFLSRLKTYAWPGNVREMQHMIERAVILTRGDRLAFGDWFQDPSTCPDTPRLMSLAELETAHILKVCEETGWRVSGKGGAAEILGLRPTTLESRMKKLGITRNRI